MKRTEDRHWLPYVLLVLVAWVGSYDSCERSRMNEEIGRLRVKVLILEAEVQRLDGKAE